MWDLFLSIQKIRRPSLEYMFNLSSEKNLSERTYFDTTEGASNEFLPGYTLSTTTHPKSSDTNPGMYTQLNVEFCTAFIMKAYFWWSQIIQEETMQRKKYDIIIHIQITGFMSQT